MVQPFTRAISNILRQNVRSFSQSCVKNSEAVLKYSVNSKIDKTVFNRYLALPQPRDKVIAKYVWIDGTGEHLRAKSRTLDFVPKDVSELPGWNYDGSSCYQAHGENSDCFLAPVRMYKDPFRGGDNILVLCDTYDFKMQPTKSNHRNACNEAIKCIENRDPWFGVEQEFTLLDVDLKPFGWPVGGFPPPQGPFYCGVGANRVYAREILECLYRACLYAGIYV